MTFWFGFIVGAAIGFAVAIVVSLIVALGATSPPEHHEPKATPQPRVLVLKLVAIDPKADGQPGSAFDWNGAGLP